MTEHNEGIFPMDDFIVSGTIGLIAFYAAILLVFAGICWYLWGMIAALMTGNYYGFLLFVLIVAAVAALYIGIGLWLKKNGTI